MGADPVAEMTGDRTVGVAIVDDHPVVVEGVRVWLASEPRLTVLSTGDDPDEVLRAAPDADVVLLDLRLHGRMALDKLAELSATGRRVVVYSEHTDPETMLAALDAGAVAFLAKHEGREHCVATVLAAASDRPYVPPALAGAMVGDPRPDRPMLSDKEREALLLWFQSMSKASVARRMRISEHTVKQYVDRARIKYTRAGGRPPQRRRCSPGRSRTASSARRRSASTGHRRRTTGRPPNGRHDTAPPDPRGSTHTKLTREVVTMHADASPFFIGPHRFDAPDDDAGPILDRRYALRPVPGEKVLGRYRLLIAGYLLGPTEARRGWRLPGPVSVTVTDQRICWVGTGAQLSLVADETPPRRAAGRPAGLMSGQIRWQWPSRLELPPAGPDGPEQLLIVCDALRTIQQPALALGGAAGEVAALARQVRRAVAMFRLTRPQLVDLSTQERDVLLLRAGPALLAGDSRVTLPGSLPVEFRSRDDYYRSGPEPTRWSGLAGGAASGRQ